MTEDRGIEEDKIFVGYPDVHVHLNVNQAFPGPWIQFEGLFVNGSEFFLDQMPRAQPKPNF
ncbi:hypothetical protein BDD12DRAFT_821590 [Trichophaea hybrida]|nr:hypothetical protein BDD12DRAFT_821590 [Trichophaea hybrida]